MSTTESRICKICKNSFGLNDVNFFRSKINKCGFRFKCKKCTITYCKKYRRKTTLKRKITLKNKQQYESLLFSILKQAYLDLKDFEFTDKAEVASSLEIGGFCSEIEKYFVRKINDEWG